MNSTTRNSLVTLASILFLLIIWKIAAVVIGAEIILPAPETTIKDFLAVLRSPSFWPAVGATVLRGLAGFLVSCLLGLVVGLAAGFSSLIYWMVQPFLTVIRSTPVMAIILLALIWFNTELVPVFVSCLMGFPIICGNIIQGIRNVDPQLVEMAHIYQVKKWRVIVGLYLPSTLPFLLAGASTAMGIIWKVIIAAEILSQPVLGIGTNMQTAKIYLETARVLSWTIAIVGVSFLFETLMRALDNKFRAWR
jgi:NitT/TauT family transport system permease protein